MNDFDKVASNLMKQAGMRVGGPQILRGGKPVRVGLPARQAQPGAGSDEAVEWTNDMYISAGDTYFGLGYTVVPANDSVEVQRNPIRPFDPFEFRCISSVQGLAIVQIDIRGTLYFANKNQPGEGMPIELFSEVSLMGGLNWETIQTDTGVSITVRNDTANPLVFAAGFRGMQLRS
jgi:hypothetical protein